MNDDDRTKNGKEFSIDTTDPYRTARNFMSIENPSEEERKIFHEWLLDADNVDHNWSGVEQCFMEDVHPVENPSRDAYRSFLRFLIHNPDFTDGWLESKRREIRNEKKMTLQALVN